MKRLSSEQLIEDAVIELQKVAPKNSSIEANVREDKGHYFTQIKLATKEKVLFVKKEDLFLYKSFNKAVKAIKSQLLKRKMVFKHRFFKNQITPLQF